MIAYSDATQMLYHGYAKNLLDIASGVLVEYATYKEFRGFFSDKLKTVIFLLILEVFFDVMLNDLYSLISL